MNTHPSRKERKRFYKRHKHKLTTEELTCAKIANIKRGKELHRNFIIETEQNIIEQERKKDEQVLKSLVKEYGEEKGKIIFQKNKKIENKIKDKKS